MLFMKLYALFTRSSAVDSKSAISDDVSQESSNTVPFWEVFSVRFLGTMQVQKDRGKYFFGIHSNV